MRRSSDWDNIGLSCRLNRLNKNSRWDKWQYKVFFCSLIRFNWRVPARVPLFSLGLKAPRSGPCGHSGRLSEVLLTHYRRREVRNSIYRYRKIHIDYRSKFSYRFISFISIIYGNTTNYIFILDLMPGLNGLGKDNCKMRWQKINFWGCGVPYIIGLKEIVLINPCYKTTVNTADSSWS